MHAEWINIVLAFVEGFALIISPCILPVLPIILSSSLIGSKARPFGIIFGFVLTFTIVTLFSKALVNYAHLEPDILRNISFVILIVLGLIMMSTYLTDKLNQWTQGLTRIGSSLDAANNPQSGFLGGILFGGLIGIIWTPCAGPIFAAVIVQIITQKTTMGSVLTIAAFALGAGMPMLIIVLLGRSIMAQFQFFCEHTVILRKLLGLVIVLSVILLMYSYSAGLSSQTIESKPGINRGLVDGIERPYQAPDIADIDTWINSAPLSLTQLRGKVVLIDFWTYSCINCLRTLPYLRDWYAKYHDKGFEIIGIHSPEFAFEHDSANVRNAVSRLGIRYPVALDNHFTTWQNFQNQYWPAHYLIDKNGNVVYIHFGEGEYATTENNIRFLLGEQATAAPTQAADIYPSEQTPETYLGYARIANFASPQGATKNSTAVYSYPDALAQNEWALKGAWIIYADKIVAASAGASIKLHFYAAKVYAVMGTQGLPVAAKLALNGELLINGQGVDVANSQIKIMNNRLYELINLAQTKEGMIELTALAPGLEIYTFTFG